MQEQTPIKLTPEQEKAYKARMKYIEKHSVKNPNNPKYEMVILEEDGSLTLTGGSEKTGIAIINRDTIKHQDMPYWRVIKANFDFYKKKNRKYYNLIVEFLQNAKSGTIFRCALSALIILAKCWKSRILIGYCSN